MDNPCCETNQKKTRPDYFLWVTSLLTVLCYLGFLFSPESIFSSKIYLIFESVFSLLNTMSWGLLLGILMLALLSIVPREFVMSILGTHHEKPSIWRATAAGLLLDLCSHGILMVGAKLYERGASIGQVMAFLIASPWNSFSLTLILITLIGLPWTLCFIVFSLLIALISGTIFDYLVKNSVLPKNPNQPELPKDFYFWREAKSRFKNFKISPVLIKNMFITGLKESRMVLRWVFFGILIASLIRVFMSPESFQNYFGPSILGLFLTIIAATIIEVCSEGSTPIAADLLTRADAPGNSFAFLMTGVSTDYTEIMVLRDLTKSWKIALFLPLITVPQVIFIAWVMNYLST